MSTERGNGGGKLGLWAWALYDWAGQSYATVIQTFVFAAYFTNRIAEDAEKATTDWSLTIGFTSFCVGLCGPVLGAVADRAGRRKPYVIGFILLCAAGTAAMWFVHPVAEDRSLGLALLALATFGTQMSIIFYNAMLGDLVPRSRYGLWSGRGWALGYAGGIVCLVAVLALFVHDHALLGISTENARHIRMSFPFVSLWLVIFVLPLCRWTPDRASNGLPLRQAVGEGLGQLKRSFGNLKRYRTVLRFLIARAFYMDGLATVFALGGVYAAGTFGMSESRILWFGIALNLSAGLGAWGFSLIDDRIGSRRTVLLTLAGLLLCSLLILVVPGEPLFWVCGITLGIFVGPVQASSRAYFSSLAPEELRTQMFGLYALAAKSTSFVGPVLVGVLTPLLGNQRLALGVIPLFFLIGWLLFKPLPDPESGSAEADGSGTD